MFAAACEGVLGEENEVVRATALQCRVLGHGRRGRRNSEQLFGETEKRQSRGKNQDTCISEATLSLWIFCRGRRERNWTDRCWSEHMVALLSKGNTAGIGHDKSGPRFQKARGAVPLLWGRDAVKQKRKAKRWDVRSFAAGRVAG
ncbi:hypothetical protein TRVL_07604 [Trypanosoma vivax]|nr:hypothetical protein TRVL_07604 [Trypanosoma vivax]